jgi:hypothetical protein
VKEHEEEWRQLCAQAAVEEDPVKLLKLIERINDLLQANRRHSDQEGPD